MTRDMTTDYKNPMTEKQQEGHDRLNTRKGVSSTKITKVCVDRLIEEIDKTLKTSK